MCALVSTFHKLIHQNLVCSNGLTVVNFQELELRRNAIVVLAFLASSGKYGFEVLLSYKPSKGTNYLMLILRVLISEAELETAERTEPPEVFKER